MGSMAKITWRDILVRLLVVLLQLVVEKLSGDSDGA